MQRAEKSWPSLHSNERRVRLWQVFDSEVLVALEADEARLPLERGEGERAWAARCGRDAAPPDVLAERDDWGAATRTYTRTRYSHSNTFEVPHASL